MTFLYDNDSNKYDGRTMHYKIEAKTDAETQSVIMTVIDKTTTCNLSTLSFKDNNVLDYPTEVY